MRNGLRAELIEAFEQLACKELPHGVSPTN
jgi:hypothetical protein